MAALTTNENKSAGWKTGVPRCSTMKAYIACENGNGNRVVAIFTDLTKGLSITAYKSLRRIRVFLISELINVCRSTQSR